jgi:hypothetical protein
MDTLRKMCENYYEYIGGCSAGGPLHILLDDNNYDIGSIQFCIDYCFEHLKSAASGDTSCSKDACLLGIMICNEYAKMSLEQRACFDSYLCGYDLDACCDDYEGDCEHCCIFDNDCHCYIEEAEDAYYDKN